MLNENDILKLVESVDVKDLIVKDALDIMEKLVETVLAPAEKKVVVSPEAVSPSVVSPTVLRRRRGRPTGHRLSPETKELIRQSKIGVARSEETKEKIRQANKEQKNPIPLEVLLNTDLSKAKQYFHNRYINVYIPNPDYNTKPFGWYLRLSRCIAEQALGRRLIKMEDRHHIDRNPLNNDPSNICVLLKKDHVRLHRILEKLVPVSECEADRDNCIWEDFKAGAL